MRFLARCSANSSRRRDVGETANGDHVVDADKDPGTVTANTVTNRVVNVDFSSCRAIAEIVEVCINDIEILFIASDERAEANIGRSEVDDDNLSDQVQEKRRRLPRWHFSAGLRVPKEFGYRARSTRTVTSAEIVLTDFRVWANLPPPFRPKSDISVPNDRRIIPGPDGDFGIRPRMSTFNRIIVTFGLSLVCAAITVEARGQANADDPSRTEVSPPVQANASRERYLMLTNGQLIKGVLSETDTECLVEQKIGVMHFPKKRVEGSFDSLRQAYEYRLAQLPDRDSDESMKLALWCLNLKLTAEARALLTAILEQSPNHPEARARLLSIEQAATRLAHRERDPDVRRTEDLDVRRTEGEPMSDQKPEALDSAVLRHAQRALGIRDLPVIFDLPLPLAIKRTEEFSRYVHPLLQVYCAKCHDAQFQGQFQLVPIKSRADRSSTALRANLDATLRLIDPENPSHSVLLSSTLRPHGNGAKRPIFPGSNDRAYMIIARWVNQLAAPKEKDEASGRNLSRVPSENDEVFAVDRNRSCAARRTKSAGADTMMPAASTSSARSGATSGVGQAETEPQEFPIPFAISGVKPNPAVPKKTSPAPAKPTSGPATSRAATGKTTATAAPAAPADRDDDEPEDLPPAPPKAKTGDSKQPPKTFKLDPKLLERTLQFRNANRSNPN